MRLIDELERRGNSVENQVKLLNKDLRIDILVEKEIIIELKCVEFLLPIHHAQIDILSETF